jgi:hypothetical protein
MSKTPAKAGVLINAITFTFVIKTTPQHGVTAACPTVIVVRQSGIQHR